MGRGRGGYEDPLAERVGSPRGVSGQGKTAGGLPGERGGGGGGGGDCSA